MRPDRPTKEQRRQLIVLAVGLVLAMSPWFSTSAALGQLRERWELGSGAASWLTIAVQLGFVVGALVSSILGLADRIPARRLLLVSTVAAAVANASIVVTDDFVAALIGRAVTGAALAGVYPPAMKAMSSWYRTGRGLALGVMIGALTIGSALPHLVNAVADLRWQPLLLVISVLTVVGGLIVELVARDGPHGVVSARPESGQLAAIVANREFRLAGLGYFGHMWELYAMWAWIAAFYGDVFTSDRAAGAAAFAVIGAGAAGSVYAGVVSDRVSRADAAAQALRWSGSIAFIFGFLVDAPAVILLAVGLVWGFWVVADSAQFSAVVTEVVEPRHVGTALTVQLAVGFTLTVFTIFLVPVVRDSAGWGWAFALLTPGPVLGAWAMRALRASADEREDEPAQSEPAPVFVSPFF